MSKASSEHPTVAAVVVNWDGGERLLSCLASLHAQSRPFDEIIVVDNASADGSPNLAIHRFPGIRMIQNETNLGFGAGVNRGVEATGAEWIALLNNDAVADRDWAAEMLTASVGSEIGMVACKIYLDRRARLIDKFGHRIAIDGQNFGRGHRQHDDGRYDGLREVAWPDGCAGLWRRSAFLSVGGLDEGFFAYADDADLGIRFRLAGWRCAFAPAAIVEHRHSQSLGPYSAQKLFLVERNRIWLATKYFPWPLLVLNPLFWAWRACLTVVAQQRGEGPWAEVSASDRWGVARAILRAQLEGWAGFPTQLRKRRLLHTYCGSEWQKRFRHLLRRERVPLRELARGSVP